MRLNIFHTVSAASVLFIIMTGIAMLVYPGGTIHDTAHPGYSLVNNFYSDLGRVTSHRGEPKQISLVFFFIALTLTSALILPLTRGIVRITDESRGVRDYLAPLSFIMAFIATGGYFGIALTPWDIFFRAHMGMVHTAFIAFMFLSFFLGLMLLRSGKEFKKPALLFIGYSVFQFAYLVLLFFGPRATDTATALLIQVVGQKIIVLLQAMVIFTEGVLLARHLNS